MTREISHIEIIKKYAKPLEPQGTGVRAGGALKAPVHAVLFDIYGTLFISSSGDISVAGEKIRAGLLSKLLKRYGIEIDAADVLNRYFGKIEKIHSRLRRKGIDFPEVEIDRVWMSVLNMESLERARRFTVEYESVFNPVWPMPFLEEIIAFLKKRKVILGIISNAQFFSPLLFEVFTGSTPEGLGFTGELIFYSFEHKYAKPSVRIYRKAEKVLKEMSIAPQSALYVGNDMLNDIYPANTVGFQTALFAGDKRSLRMRKDDLRCSNLTPDLIITDLMDLSEHLIRYR
ncbi:MAG: HAD family hydrolase [Spirochaetes bacterium]|nr:HAD family hydrolase [Spirochaetota bacterium]